jgi:hypothetical protein
MATTDGGAKWLVDDINFLRGSLSCSPGAEDCAVLGVPSSFAGKSEPIVGLSTTDLLHWQAGSMPARPSTKYGQDDDFLLSCAGRGRCLGLETEVVSGGIFQYPVLRTVDNGLMWTRAGSLPN